MIIRDIELREAELLKEENKRLKVLLHLAENLQAQLELKKLLQTTMEEVAKILNADRCTVFLLDEEKNEQNPIEDLISSDSSPVKIGVIPTNEELIVAQEVEKFLQGVKHNE